MTLKEIADAAGVSTATVSYVINNSPKVSDKTRKRVQKIIEETGYHSNILAQGLRKTRSGIIGILSEDITVGYTDNIIDGISQIADRKYNIILSNLRLQSKIGTDFGRIGEYKEDIDRAVDVLLSMQVDGIIYVGMHDRKLNHVIKQTDKPVVYCHCYTTDVEGSSIRYDDENTVYRMTRMLINRGHRRIAIINGREGSEPAQLRYNGFRKALRENKITLPRRFVERGNWNFQGGKDAALRLLSTQGGGDRVRLLPEEERPTAIMAMNDDMAIGVYNAVAQLGLTIPDDLSVSGFDNADIATHLMPSLMTAKRPLQTMGYRAFELLERYMGASDRNIVDLMFPCQIIEGESVKTILRDAE